MMERQSHLSFSDFQGDGRHHEGKINQGFFHPCAVRRTLSGAASTLKPSAYVPPLNTSDLPLPESVPTPVRLPVAGSE